VFAILLDKIKVCGDMLESGILEECWRVGGQGIGLLGAMSLACILCLRQFCSPLLGFFRLVPGFVRSIKLFSDSNVNECGGDVTEFEAAAFDGFNYQWLRFCIASLHLVSNPNSCMDLKQAG